MSRTSYRENIAKDIEASLKSIKSVKYVSRDVFEIDELSDAQFPAVLVQTGPETKEEICMGMGGYHRQGTIEYVLTGFVKGKYLDSARNKLADDLEEKLYEDVTRGGYAHDTVVLEINTDEGVIFPLGGIQMLVRVTYVHRVGELDKP
jgi:hypothetical protein